MIETITIERFREIAPQRLKILEGNGFTRKTSLEDVTPTTSTIVYLGQHVGFVFSFDVRDQCVDAEVVKVKNGQMLRNWDGGYSADIFAHLVRHEGYRGNPAAKANHNSETSNGKSLEKMIDAWIGLLNRAGQTLFEDEPSSLP
jgi:hypothetical protein